LFLLIFCGRGTNYVVFMRDHKASFCITLGSKSNTCIAQQTNIFVKVAEETLIVPFLIKIMQEFLRIMLLPFH
jgi:hypothetical protein